MMSCGESSCVTASFHLRPSLNETYQPSSFTKGRAMPDAFYCALCQQFLQGKIDGKYRSPKLFIFDHHRSFESFDKAIKLPCSICSLAGCDALEPPPAFNWERPMKAYFGSNGNEDQFTLSMCIIVEGKNAWWGWSLIFVPWPCPSKSSFRSTLMLLKDLLLRPSSISHNHCHQVPGQTRPSISFLASSTNAAKRIRDVRARSKSGRLFILRDS